MFGMGRVGEGGGADEGVAGAGAVVAAALDALEVVHDDGLVFSDGGDGLHGAGFGALDAGETTFRRCRDYLYIVGELAKPSVSPFRFVVISYWLLDADPKTP